MPTSSPENPGPVQPTDSSSPDADWATQRREAAAERARMMRERAEAEHARAARIVSLFVRVARDQGLEPEPLVVRGYAGGTARTRLRGWYLRADRTVAIDVDGHFYVLSMSLSLKDRLTGVTPAAEPVPLTIGEGGRDGDIVPLRFALERLLPGWEALSPEPLA